jgi:Ca2+/Na+ antiporter
VRHGLLLLLLTNLGNFPHKETWSTLLSSVKTTENSELLRFGVKRIVIFSLVTSCVVRLLMVPGRVNYLLSSGCVCVGLYYVSSAFHLYFVTSLLNEIRA